MGKYIDGSGLSHFMGILKGYFVPQTRKVNGHALSADVTITKSDVGLGSTANGAEVNQNAFSNVKVGDNTIAADSKTDTLELVAGSNVTLTPDATNDKVTIAATDTTYSALKSDATAGLAVWDGATNDGLYLMGANILDGDVTFTGYVLAASDIPSLDASKITSGTFGTDRIPSLAASKITSGTFDAARIPSLAISKITNLQTSLDAKAPLASPALTGTPTAPTATAGTNTTQIATTAFVANAVTTATTGALQYKGTVTAESGISGTAYKKGWYWIVAMPNSTTTSITIAGKNCEAGDMVIAKQDKTSTLANDLDIVQSNIEVLSNSEIDALWAAA